MPGQQASTSQTRREHLKLPSEMSRPERQMQTYLQESGYE